MVHVPFDSSDALAPGAPPAMPNGSRARGSVSSAGLPKYQAVVSSVEQHVRAQGVVEREQIAGGRVGAPGGASVMAVPIDGGRQRRARRGPRVAERDPRVAIGKESRRLHSSLCEHVLLDIALVGPLRRGSAGADRHAGDPERRGGFEVHPDRQRHGVLATLHPEVHVCRGRGSFGRDGHRAEVVVDALEHAGALVVRFREKLRREVLFRHRLELLGRSGGEGLHIGVGAFLRPGRLRASRKAGGCDEREGEQSECLTHARDYRRWS